MHQRQAPAWCRGLCGRRVGSEHRRGSAKCVGGDIHQHGDISQLGHRRSHR
ncbi:MAG: hypothetical protein M3137_12215 [Actinomycetota bacterium]|nr:hypothetical protein [Actinomycetota bacterium]